MSVPRILFPLFILFMVLSQQPAVGQDGPSVGIKTLSQLQLIPNRRPAVGAACCKGSVDSATAAVLEKINISQSDLAKVVDCTVGDFDGNGYMDFAIWGNRKKDVDSPDPDYENYVVIFFDKDRVIRTIPIRRPHPGELLIYYPPRAIIGPNGEPITAHDALWLLGSTDEYDDDTKGIVYIFDKESGQFNQIQFGKK